VRGSTVNGGIDVDAGLVNDPMPASIPAGRTLMFLARAAGLRLAAVLSPERLPLDGNTSLLNFALDSVNHRLNPLGESVVVLYY
jgi:hypothetical protein